jgi:hypothetical protein
MPTRKDMHKFAAWVRSACTSFSVGKKQRACIMQGDGDLGEWLKQTGREVARAAGHELKSVAKDKAASYARSMIGEGLKQELGDAAGAVGQAALKEAKKHGKHKAKQLISKYFGGDGIGRPCAYKIGDLRKAVTTARRANHITGPANREQLMHIGEQHADMKGDIAKQIRRNYMEQTPITVPMLRKMRSIVKESFHPPVSRLNRTDVIRYIYMTAKHLGWSWTQLEGRTMRKNQPRGCRGSAAPGRDAEPPARALGTASKRKPSAYNLFIKRHMAKNQDGDVRERFSDAVEAWRAGAGRRSGAKRAASTRAHKKAAPARERARVSRLKQTAREEYEERGQDPRVARIRGSKIPKKRTSSRLQGRGMYGYGYSSDSDDE